MPVNGFFNVNKPRGVTSHDVVAAIRRASRERRVGHAGTLDPAAEGVLLVCLGPATRVVEYLMDSHKRYLATVVLGVTTTTDDAEGQVISRRDASGVARADVERVLAHMVGRVLQVPPMYSALKVQGKPLYKLARSGVEVEREPREVEILDLQLLDFEPPRLRLGVLCGKGTYVRTIAHDLGEHLGCGAHLERLVRTAVGRFVVEDAVPLQRLVDALEHGQWENLIYPTDEALIGLDAIVVGQEGERRITTGSSWRPSLVLRRPAGQSLCRVYSLDGLPLGIAEFDPSADNWRPVKTFVHAGA